MTSTDFVERFVRDARVLGVREGDVLLVHSTLGSFRRSRPPGGDADGAGHVGRANPIFDVRTTRSNVGIIPETFRGRADVVRSLHPTHSVCAAGARAAELIDGHLEDTTPCGPRSPFARLPRIGGGILMLGCSLSPKRRCTRSRRSPARRAT